MAKRITISSDEGHKETEKKLKELEAKIKREYEQAQKEIDAKVMKRLKSTVLLDEENRKKVKEGLMTEEQYKQWRLGRTSIDKRWIEMRDTIAEDLMRVSELARSTAEGYMPEVYALNHNYATFQVEQSSLLDTSYTLYDRQTVERLMRENPKLMPRMSDETARKIREGKLIKWNEQKIQSAVTQGILQGEPISRISKRLREVTDMDYKASIRNARTAITSAQNGGRMDAYHRAEDMGIHQKKQWLSVLDDRTRHTHVVLDGQRQEIDDPFVVVDDYGVTQEIMYPADPDADPSMVYNCRCTMITQFEDYDKTISDIELPEDSNLKDMSYDEWKKEHSGKSHERKKKKINR